MKYFLNNLKNNFDFFLRNHLVISRKNYCEKNSMESVMLDSYFLSVFKKYLTCKKGRIKALDVGSKNWEYVKSEYYFFKSFSADFTLNGIELDPYRLNSNFYNRLEIAKFHTKNLKNTNYITGDFLEHEEAYDYIIWILPFITQYPLVKWGLPLKYFKPEEMLNHAFSLLNMGGELLIINQGEKEYEIQRELNRKLHLPAQYFGEIEDEYKLFKNKRYCSKIVKN